MPSFNEMYVRRKKQKILAKLIGTVSAAGLSVFIILAFIGKTIGTFTIQLENELVALALSRTHDFEESSTYLKINSIPKLDLSTYQWVKDYDTSLTPIDSEYTSMENYSYEYNHSLHSYFFKYTYFIKNVGDKTAYFNMSVDIVENNPPTNGVATLDEYLRVAIYRTDNVGLFEHTDVSYYCKASTTEEPTLDKKGVMRRLEHIGDESSPYCDYTFEGTDRVTSSNEGTLDVGEIRRYTILFWFEGNDPQNGYIKDRTGDSAPKGGSIKLGVNIDAHEQKNE